MGPPHWSAVTCRMSTHRERRCTSPSWLLLGATRWRAGQRPRAAACATILESGGTITHHHAVGTDHRGYLSREIGGRGVSALRALAGELDPAGS